MGRKEVLPSRQEPQAIRQYPQGNLMITKIQTRHFLPMYQAEEKTNGTSSIRPLTEETSLTTDITTSTVIPVEEVSSLTVITTNTNATTVGGHKPPCTNPSTIANNRNGVTTTTATNIKNKLPLILLANMQSFGNREETDKTIETEAILKSNSVEIAVFTETWLSDVTAERLPFK